MRCRKCQWPVRIHVDLITVRYYCMWHGKLK